MKNNYDVKDLSLAEAGRKKIEWAAQDMPVLESIRQEAIKTKPLQGFKIAACLHVTSETANLMRTFKDAGASVVLVASNPLSTQDEVAASLVKHYQIAVFARHGESRRLYYQHLQAALAFHPQITLDDGADLVSLLHKDYQKQVREIQASLEETTTGVIRLRALAASGKLLLPVIAVNDAKTKHMFDNRYGTGQSTLDGIIRATNMLIAGKTVVVAGYGWCGRGFANRARGLGAKVIVTEVDEIKALEAAMDGFSVLPMKEAAPLGDLFCTLSGDLHVIDSPHFKLMKDGAIVCNSGHFDVEINVAALKKIATKVRKQVRPQVDEYLVGKKRIYLLAEGRLINLAAAEGHPASVMDMSFATQALSALAVAKGKKLEIGVHSVSGDIENRVARLKLKSMGISIDKLTPEQKKYLSSWEAGT
ncbi:MAG: adenosylhomocysteinase [Patescibacteria group bacterium]|nr:adenosylhomocysteinase [Patescibacteria group bacterium]